MEIQLWREILDPYRLAVDELVVKFNHIIEEYRNAGLYSPIEQVTGRVKKISSILDKMQKKNIAIEEIDDRVVVNQSKCISCGKCLETCPVKGAMRGVFVNNLEEQKKKEEKK